MSRRKRTFPPPGSPRPPLEIHPHPLPRAAQARVGPVGAVLLKTLEHGETRYEDTPFTLERWNTLFESGQHSVKVLEDRVKDLPVTSRWIARLQLELFADELEPG